VGVVSGLPTEIDNEAKLGIVMADSRPRVDDVVARSGAEKAGLRVGDTILSVNGTRVATADAVVDSLGQCYAGDMLRLRVLREATELDISALLGRRSDMDPAQAEFQDFLGGDLSQRRSGFPRVLQHDTVLLPKHCGGPVVDSEGNFVGVNIARAARVASYLIPADALQPLVSELKSGRFAPTETVNVRK
jgi:serine protease Do